jgi:hypothetical protein
MEMGILGVVGHLSLTSLKNSGNVQKNKQKKPNSKTPTQPDLTIWLYFYILKNPTPLHDKAKDQNQHAAFISFSLSLHSASFGFTPKTPACCGLV